MSIRGRLSRYTYQYSRTGMYIRSDMLTPSVLQLYHYSTTMTCVRYVLRSIVLTRILRGGALSKHNTWNDITATPTRLTRLARRDNQCFDGCLPPPLYPHTDHEAPLIRCEWRDRVDRLPAFKDTIAVAKTSDS